VLVPLTDCASFVREPTDGVLSSAAVPRCGLRPLPPPLCRCAEYTADQLSRTWRAYLLNRTTQATGAIVVRVRPRAYQAIRSPGAWCAQRSGIKEEAAGRGTAAELCTPSAMASTVKRQYTYGIWANTELQIKRRPQRHRLTPAPQMSVLLTRLDAHYAGKVYRHHGSNVGNAELPCGNKVTPS
jgi:hypothetical protein